VASPVWGAGVVDPRLPLSKCKEKDSAEGGAAESVGMRRRPVRPKRFWSPICVTYLSANDPRAGIGFSRNELIELKSRAVVIESDGLSTHGICSTVPKMCL
jgi:hypothetical protein